MENKDLSIDDFFEIGRKPKNQEKRNISKYEHFFDFFTPDAVWKDNIIFDGTFYSDNANPYKDEIIGFSLIEKYKTTYDGKKYYHELLPMSDGQIIVQFIQKCIFYKERLDDFLNFHYEKYGGGDSLNSWIDNVCQIIFECKYFGISHYDKKILNTKTTNWANIKRKELQELESTPTAEAVEVKQEPQQERVKLRFRNAKGDKKALYYVLQQLSEREILPKKDWLHIAEFLVQNVEGFENNKPNDIAGELSRTYDPPKDKNKINLPES